MPRNSSGIFNVADPAFAPNNSIIASQMNDNMNDIASALTTTMATTGVSTMTGQAILALGAVSMPSMIFSADTTTGFYLAGTNTWGFAASSTEIFSIDTNGITMTPGNGGDFIDLNSNKLYGLPIGIVVPMAGATPTDGWTLCFGQAVSRTTYAGLFAVISTTFGTGDGSTTFNLPDMRGRIPVTQDNLGGSSANRVTGASTNGITGNVLGNVGGLQTATITIATLPSATYTNNLTITVLGGTPVYKETATANLAGGSGPVGSEGIMSISVGSVTGSIGTGGSDTPYNNVQPTIIMNYMIYHGVFP